jgi:RNA polymerase sigma-70 factor (ECF subfamily)
MPGRESSQAPDRRTGEVGAGAHAPPRAAGTEEMEAVGALDAELATHVPHLLLQARRLTTSATEAQDLVQDTMERAVKSLRRFTPGTNMRAWLYTILVRRACDVHRQRRSQRHSDVVETDTLPAPTPEEQSIWVHVTDADLQQAVSCLRVSFREVFELHEVHHLCYQDIAMRLGIPVGTVGTRLRRAREKLRKTLTKVLHTRGVTP